MTNKGRRCEVELFPTQESFFFSEAKFPAFIGGYGSGKTFVFVFKAITLAFENPGLPGMLIEPTYRLIEDTLRPELESQLKRYGISYQWKASNTEYILSNGSIIKLRSADNPSRLKGPNIAWGGIDEVAICDKEIFPVLVSRVRHHEASKRQVFVVGTPEGRNWVYKLWEKEPKEGFELFRAHTAENTLNPAEYIELLRLTHTAEELKQKLEGFFVDVSVGYVYGKYFHPVESVTASSPFTEDNSIVSEHLPINICADFNIGHARWVLTQDRDGYIYAFDEIAMSDAYTWQLAQEVNTRYGDHPGGFRVYGDASGKSRNTITSKVDYDIIREAGFSYQDIARSNPPVKDRVVTVNLKLKDNKGNRWLTVHPQCKKLRDDLTEVKWKKNATGIIDKESDPELTHPSDAIGYFVCQKFPITGFKKGEKMSMKGNIF